MNSNPNDRLREEAIFLTDEIRNKYPEQIRKSIVETEKFNDVRVLNLENKQKYEQLCKIEIIYEDTADAGYQLQQEGLNPMLLNMASFSTPGGGWRKGSNAQEESLFYRSMYYLALENPKYYPIQLYSAVYTPDVFFFRSKQIDGYKVLPYENCSFLSCLAVPAIRRPNLTDKGRFRPSDRRITIEKIRGIFKIAVLKEHDSVVVGALGSGAYGNNPIDIAEIFLEVIPEYKKYFKNITFAILDYYGSKNYSIFRDILKPLLNKMRSKWIYFLNVS